jgi:hypothetical protein
VTGWLRLRAAPGSVLRAESENMTSYEAGAQQAQFAQAQGWNPQPIENGGVRGEADSIADNYRAENGSLDGFSRSEAIAGWNDAL